MIRGGRDGRGGTCGTPETIQIAWTTYTICSMIQLHERIRLAHAGLDRGAALTETHGARLKP